MTMSNISINDGKGTPEAHVFVPHVGQIGAKHGVWFNKLTGFSSLAWETLRTLVGLSDGKSQNRALMSVETPKVVLIDGVEKYLGKLGIYITVVADPGLNTDANLADIFALGKNLLANAEADKVLKTFTPSM
jgi:hypothetical protein